MSLRHAIATALFSVAKATEPPAPITGKQMNFIFILCEQTGATPPTTIVTMSRREGSELIDSLIRRRDAA